MKSLFVLTFVLFQIHSAHAAVASIEESELVCKNKAKELASESFKSCVTESRNVRIDQIRKEYQQKLQELKTHYDGQLKTLSDKSEKDLK